MTTYTASDRKRFYSKTKLSGPGCLEWTGYTDSKGYGKFYLAGKAQLAHRVGWLMAGGDIPDGSIILHVCDNPTCVRIDHLRIGTHADNSADMIVKGRSATGDKNGSRKRPDRVPRGERHCCAKLTDANVSELRHMRASGATYTELGKAFGIDRTTAFKIAKGTRWRHTC